MVLYAIDFVKVKHRTLEIKKRAEKFLWLLVFEITIVVAYYNYYNMLNDLRKLLQKMFSNQFKRKSV